jgi:formylglycine-generating enzyme required for sulfatase activity
MLRTIRFALLCTTLIFVLFVIGCDGDDDPITPAPPTTGTVIINCSPETLDIPWTLALPGGLAGPNGVSDSTLTDMPSGAYILTWGAVDGWTVPDPNPTTASLEADSSIVFSGVYLETPPALGTIVIHPEPNNIDAPWQLSGPDGSLTAGAGDLTLEDLVAGEYSIEWGNVVEWNAPANSLQTLPADGTITFNGIYSANPGPVPGFVLIPPASESMPATFTMGSTIEAIETPHQVTLTGRFDMASTEVTNAQYVEVLQWAYDQGHVTVTSTSVRDALDGAIAELLFLDDSDCQISFSGGVFSTSYPDRPVVEVSWFGALAYCDWLSLQEGLPRAYDHRTWICNNGNPYTASGYRLPTEAEWEFACRAGTTTEFNTGDCLDSGTEANYRGSTSDTSCPPGPFFGRTANVGSYPANQWGLFDMHGNVWEWCNDFKEPYNGDETDPAGAETGRYRVLRGGSWIDNISLCRSAFRFSPSHIHTPFVSMGFRPVRSVP